MQELTTLIGGKECLLNFPSEVALYASRGRYLAKVMLFTVRYLALGCCIILLRVVWNLSNSSKQECRYSVRFSALLGVTSMVSPIRLAQRSSH